MEFKEGLRQAVELRGKSILFDGMLVNILDDLHAFKDQIQTRNILKFFLTSQYVTQIKDAVISAENGNKKISYAEIRRIIAYFVEDFAIDSTKVEAIVQNIISSYGTELIDSQLTASLFLGAWQFHYNAKTVTDLFIYNDGKATTSNGVTLTWELKSDSEIVLCIGQYIRYEGELRGDEIYGVAYNELNGISWSWNAKSKHETLEIEDIIDGVWILSHEISDLQDDVLKFTPNGSLVSDNYGKSKWELINNKLSFTLSSGFIKLIAQERSYTIIGTATNEIGMKWKFKLTKKI